jgi:hypothetical protein
MGVTGSGYGLLSASTGLWWKIAFVDLKTGNNKVDFSQTVGMPK